MKAVKLTITFIVILGIIVGAFCLFSVPDTAARYGTGATGLDELCGRIENNWRTAGDWEPDTFRHHIELIRLYESDMDARVLYNRNTNMADSIIDARVFGEWKKPACRRANIDKYIAALDTIARHDSGNNDNGRVKLIRRVNGTYRQALAVAHRQLGLQPHFNGTGWNSFAAYSQDIKRQRDLVKADTVYTRYLAAITDISEGLNSIDSRLSQARDRFYKSLDGQIHAHFAAIPHSDRDDNRLRQLIRLRDNFRSEYRDSRSLNDLVWEYRNDIANNNDR